MDVYFHRALLFLVEFLFGVYILLFMLRLLLERSRAELRNPIAMALTALTEPPMRLLRPLLPPLRRVDVRIPVILLGLQAMQLVILYLLRGGPMTAAGLTALTLTELLELIIHLYLFSIMLMAILSWIAPYGHTPLGALLGLINAPLLRPLRHTLPPVHGLDFTPLVAILLLLLARIVVHAPLHDQAMVLMRAA